MWPSRVGMWRVEKETELLMEVRVKCCWTRRARAALMVSRKEAALEGSLLSWPSVEAEGVLLENASHCWLGAVCFEKSIFRLSPLSHL